MHGEKGTYAGLESTWPIKVPSSSPSPAPSTTPMDHNRGAAVALCNLTTLPTWPRSSKAGVAVPLFGADTVQRREVAAAVP